jgi:hypothetical protein
MPQGQLPIDLGDRHHNPPITNEVPDFSHLAGFLI